MRAFEDSPVFIFVLAWLILCSGSFGHAEPPEPSGDLIDLPLEQLMEMDVAVASGKSSTIREAPGIVSVVTAEEIRSSGARDLIEILQMVPGIQFGIDSGGVISIGIRGLWAAEGKALLLWDGHELNELMYATIQLGNHYPVDQIERVEIVRGPGSALYGGFAELAVINIITRNYAEGEHSGETTVSYGQLSKTFARRNVNVAFRKKFEDLTINTALFLGEGNRSSKNYADINGDSFNLSDNAQLNPENYRLDLNYGDLDFRFLYDNYKTTERDYYGENLPKSINSDFESYYLDLRYVYQVSSRLKITPRINFRKQVPYFEPYDIEADNQPYDKAVQKKQALIIAEYDHSDDLAFMLGTSYSEDRAVDRLAGSYFFNNESSLQYHDLAVFGQAIYEASIANFTLGGRYYDHQAYGSAFVPRFSVTKAIKDIHFKLLASEAFRAPSLEDISLNHILVANGYPGAENIRSDKTEAYDFETGYSFTDSASLVMNIFQARINDPIVYFYDNVSEAEGYINAGHMGSRGVESELRLTKPWGYFNVSYSFYQSYKSDAQTYVVGNGSNYLIGFARNQISSNFNIKLSDTFKLNTFLTMLGKRYGYSRLGAYGLEVLIRPYLPIFIYPKISEVSLGCRLA